MVYAWKCHLWNFIIIYVGKDIHTDNDKATVLCASDAGVLFDLPIDYPRFMAGIFYYYPFGGNFTTW